ncbi:AEC family transporter [Synechococcus sp. AH-603-L18]|nr:AEC family transporter [Synechococcus sp. AH-603-L18]MDB4338170.1 AEC family transporter [Synechococcus sp. AH-603-L18]
MTVSLTIILPIFMIIATGFFFARIKIIDASSGAQLMQYVFYCAAPFTVYYALTGNSSASFFYWPFWIAYPICYLIIIIGSYFVFKFLRRRETGISLALGFCASLGNTVLVAYPILIGITGARAAVPMAISVIVVNIIFMPSWILLLEFERARNIKNEYKYQNNVFKKATKATLLNPIVIATFIGILARSVGIESNQVVTKFLIYISGSLVPVALFAVGLSMSELKVKSFDLDVLMVVITKLAVAPIVAIIISKIFALNDFYSVTLVIFMSIPLAKSIYVVSGKYNIFDQETAQVISYSTALSVFTIPVWIHISHMLWPAAFA